MNSPAVAIKFDTPVVHIATGPLYCFAVTKTKQVRVYFFGLSPISFSSS